MSKVWTGATPKTCSVCSNPIHLEFYDARTKLGYWAYLCPLCFPKMGTGLGLGRGQQYTRPTLCSSFEKTGG